MELERHKMNEETKFSQHDIRSRNLNNDFFHFKELIYPSYYLLKQNKLQNSTLTHPFAPCSIRLVINDFSTYNINTS